MRQNYLDTPRPPASAPYQSGFARKSAANNISTNSTSMVELSTSLRVNITVPPSGRIRIIQSLAFVPSAGQDVFLGFALSTTSAWVTSSAYPVEDAPGSGVVQGNPFNNMHQPGSGLVMATEYITDWTTPGIVAGPITVFYGWNQCCNTAFSIYNLAAARGAAPYGTFMFVETLP